MAKQKTFLCVYDCRMGETEIQYRHLAEGVSKAKVEEIHEVEHDNGLDCDNSPIGGAEGQYFTELIDVIPVTPTQKKFLNKIGIH
jgi:hypothetical protein